MHSKSYEQMMVFAEEHVPRPEEARGMELGSLDVNGSYRPLFPRVLEYIGVDIRPGKAVDVVLAEPYRYPWSSEYFDVVISGQALEHMTHPWKAITEMARVLKRNGKTCLIAPWRWAIHRHPLDCFRILPDGMQSISGQTI